MSSASAYRHTFEVTLFKCTFSVTHHIVGRRRNDEYEEPEPLVVVVPCDVILLRGERYCICHLSTRWNMSFPQLLDLRDGAKLCTLIGHDRRVSKGWNRMK